MRHLKHLLLGLAAGVSIAFGGMVNIMCRYYGHPIAGSFLFAVGLFLICICGFYLFTGRIGHALDKEKNKHNILDFILMYVGNFIGAAGTGLLLSLCISDEVSSFAHTYVGHKLVDVGNGNGQQFYQMMIMAFFCGVLVYLAVHLFNHEKLHPVVRVLGLILCVGTFVVCGFEHCIADMFYFGIIRVYFSSLQGNLWLSILLGSIFNALGAICTWLLFKFAAKTTQKVEN